MFSISVTTVPQQSLVEEALTCPLESKIQPFRYKKIMAHPVGTVPTTNGTVPLFLTFQERCFLHGILLYLNF